MSRRRQLKGTAAGVLSSFVSRNNDIGGYWGLGVIYAELATLPSAGCQLDLLTSESVPGFSQAEKVATAYRQHLFRLVEKTGLNANQITNASIGLMFNLAEPVNRQAGKASRGEPFRCQMSITDDLGTVWQYCIEGWCRKHNPRKEQRSVR